MTYRDILTLLKAGYSKDEIDAMDDSKEVSKPVEPAPAPAPVETEPAPVKNEEQSTAKNEEPAQSMTAQQLENLLNKLIAGMQANNRLDAEMGARIIDPHTTAIDTMRSISDIPNNRN